MIYVGDEWQKKEVFAGLFFSAPYRDKKNSHNNDRKKRVIYQSGIGVTFTLTWPLDKVIGISRPDNVMEEKRTFYFRKRKKKDAFFFSFSSFR